MFQNNEPIARNVDPITSKLSEDSLTKSGLRDRQKLMVLEIVKKNPGLTSRELAHVSKVNNEVLHKRLPDLRADDLVENGEIRICAVTGHKALTWMEKF